MYWTHLLTVWILKWDAMKNLDLAYFNQTQLFAVALEQSDFDWVCSSLYLVEDFENLEVLDPDGFNYLLYFFVLYFSNLKFLV